MTEQDNFSSLFAPEPAQSEKIANGDIWKVLLVDDEPDIHAVLRLALQDIVLAGRPLQLIDARSSEEGRARLAEHPDIALILLDVVMETEQAGLELVRYIRQALGNRIIQIVLITGQPGYAPQREVIQSFEIDGYRLKSELTADKIFVSVYAALRTYKAMRELERQREQLQIQTETLSRWGHIFEHAEWGIVIGSVDGKRIEQANPAFARQHGYTVDEVVALPIAALFDLEERASLAGHIQKSHELGHYSFESRHLRKDGTTFPVLMDVTAVKNEQGEILYCVVNVQDISDRKQVVELLRKERDFAETLLHTAPAIVLVLDPLGRIVRINPYLEAISGYTQEEVKGRDWFSLFLPVATRDQTRTLFMGAINDIQTHGNIDALITRSGQERVIEWYDKTLKDNDGKTLGLLAIGQDVTERKKMENALVASEHRLSEAQRIAHLGSWQLDLVNNKLDWSDEIFHIFEIDKQQFGASYEAFLNAIHPEDREQVNQAYAESLSSRKPYAIVHRLLMKDGRIKFVEERGEVFYDENGNALSSVGTVHDVTRLKQIEAKLNELNHDLEQRVEDRTRELYETNRRLETFNEIMVEREMRVVEIKQEVNRLCKELGRELLYKDTAEALSSQQDVES